MHSITHKGFLAFVSDCLLATRGVTIEDMEAIWKEVGKRCSCDRSSQTSSPKQDVLISAHSQSRALKHGWIWTFDDGTARAQVKKADEKVILEDTFSHGQTLKRHEFLQVLVHIALVRYMRVERVADFSDAVDEMLRSGIVANVPAEALQNSNIFRQKHCYTEAIEHVLRRHTDWLRVRALLFPTPELVDFSSLPLRPSSLTMQRSTPRAPLLFRRAGRCPSQSGARCLCISTSSGMR